jgi:hypothetical protein
MHAVIFGMSGISELHRRNASPVHICCASSLNAKLEVDDSAATEATTASAKLAWRSALVERCGHFWLPWVRRVSGALLMAIGASTPWFGM